ncbi:MAG: GTPase [Candidatus Hodarchaeota archaeon]
MKEKPLLLIIGNSNVGKSAITKLLLPQPSKYKGKSGKKPGSTLLIKQITQHNLSYKIVDLPGFGYMDRSSKRREEHIKKQIINYIENHYFEYFLALVIINIIRIEDELKKYFIENRNTIPLSFELLKFLREFKIPILLIFNKVDKISNREKTQIISFFIESAKQYGIEIVYLDEFIKDQNEQIIPYLDFSAIRKINLGKLNHFISSILSQRLS